MAKKWDTYGGAMLQVKNKFILVVKAHCSTMRIAGKAWPDDVIIEATNKEIFIIKSVAPVLHIRNFKHRFAPVIFFKSNSLPFY